MPLCPLIFRNNWSWGQGVGVVEWHFGIMSYCDNLIMSNADEYLNSKSNFEILTTQELPAILRLNRYVESDKSCRVQLILSAIPCINLSIFLNYSSTSVGHGRPMSVFLGSIHNWNSDWTYLDVGRSESNIAPFQHMKFRISYIGAISAIYIIIDIANITFR